MESRAAQESPHGAGAFRPDARCALSVSRVGKFEWKQASLKLSLAGRRQAAVQGTKETLHDISRSAGTHLDVSNCTTRDSSVSSPRPAPPLQM